MSTTIFKASTFGLSTVFSTPCDYASDGISPNPFTHSPL